MIEFLGYSFSHEYLLEGFQYQYTDRVEIRIFSIVKIEKLHNLSSLYPIREIKHMAVEIRSVTSEDELHNTQNKLWRYAKQIEPIVKFTKTPI